MSGFTRDTHWYGDRLVYEALGSKWGRHHGNHCGCGRDWVSAHAEPAGFIVVRRGGGFVALVGPGLTEDVDEAALTTDALWQAVTGKPGASWVEPVRVVDRSSSAEAARKAANQARYAPLRARSAAAAVELLTEPQLRYLTALAARVDRARFDQEFIAAIKGNHVTPLQPGEDPQQAITRLTNKAARTLISALKAATK